MSGDGRLVALGAAERLVGTTLLDTWLVVEAIQRDPGISGGSRSCCYRARDQNGRSAFVKAFDFRRDEREHDIDFLDRCVRSFKHERDVHLYCRDRRLTRVTRIYGADRVLVGDEVVHFIVCEWADECLRERQPPGDKRVSLADRFVALRNAASALAQLHSVGIAHQDLKPSNAVFFQSGELKLTDLGSSACENLPAPPHDLQTMAGQPNYAPYELLYNDGARGWDAKHFGCDLFLLGNLIFTTLVGSSITIAVLHGLPRHLRPDVYDVAYSELIPTLIDNHEMIVPVLLGGVLPEELLADTNDLIWCLCNPNPAKRGHPKNVFRTGNPFGLERIVSKLESLARRAALNSRGQQ